MESESIFLYSELQSGVGVDFYDSKESDCIWRVGDGIVFVLRDFFYTKLRLHGFGVGVDGVSCIRIETELFSRHAGLGIGFGVGRNISDSTNQFMT